MKFKKSIAVIALLIGFYFVNPVVAAEDNEVSATAVRKFYPKKYTEQYIKQITPTYKDVGKDDVFYVALDMLIGTNGQF